MISWEGISYHVRIQSQTLSQLAEIRPETWTSCLQSKKGAELMYRYPILLDACANEMQRQGDSMMSKWAEVQSPSFNIPHWVAYITLIGNRRM